MDLDVEIVEADLNRSDYQRDIVAMTSAYALDPMGNGGPLAEEALARLISGLKNHPTTLIFLAYVDRQPVAIATCFYGFSTFHAKPLINIHDLAVVESHRGRGIGRQMLERVEQKAKETGCCKVTLEVLEKNARARSVYTSCGYGPAASGQATDEYLFYTKSI